MRIPAVTLDLWLDKTHEARIRMSGWILDTNKSMGEETIASTETRGVMQSLDTVDNIGICLWKFAWSVLLQEKGSIPSLDLLSASKSRLLLALGLMDI